MKSQVLSVFVSHNVPLVEKMTQSTVHNLCENKSIQLIDTWEAVEGV